MTSSSSTPSNNVIRNINDLINTTRIENHVAYSDEKEIKADTLFVNDELAFYLRSMLHNKPERNNRLFNNIINQNLTEQQLCRTITGSILTLSLEHRNTLLNPSIASEHKVNIHKNYLMALEPLANIYLDKYDTKVSLAARGITIGAHRRPY